MDVRLTESKYRCSYTPFVLTITRKHDITNFLDLTKMLIDIGTTVKMKRSDAHMEAWSLGKHKYPKGYWL